MAPIRRAVKFYLSDPGVLFRYVGAGGTAALVEWSLFSALYQWSGWPLLAANCFAFSVAVLLCFFLQKHWTFKAVGSTQRQLSLYLVMQGVSAVLNNVLMWILVEEFRLFAPFAKVLQIGLVFFWNFAFCRLVVFVGSNRPARRVSIK